MDTTDKGRVRLGGFAPTLGPVDTSKVRLRGFLPPPPGVGGPTRAEFIAFAVSGGTTPERAADLARMAFEGMRGSDSLLAWSIGQELLAMMRERAR